MVKVNLNDKILYERFYLNLINKITTFFNTISKILLYVPDFDYLYSETIKLFWTKKGERDMGAQNKLHSVYLELIINPRFLHPM